MVDCVRLLLLNNKNIYLFFRSLNRIQQYSNDETNANDLFINGFMVICGSQQNMIQPPLINNKHQ